MNDTSNDTMLTSVYTLSYLESNPLKCYVSKPESFLDTIYFEHISTPGFYSKHFPLYITTDPNDKYTSDLAVLPESTIVLEKKTLRTHTILFVI